MRETSSGGRSTIGGGLRRRSGWLWRFAVGKQAGMDHAVLRFWGMVWQGGDGVGGLPGPTAGGGFGVGCSRRESSERRGSFFNLDREGWLGGD
jgi:hypothetical protein